MSLKSKKEVKATTGNPVERKVEKTVIIQPIVTEKKEESKVPTCSKNRYGYSKVTKKDLVAAGLTAIPLFCATYSATNNILAIANNVKNPEKTGKEKFKSVIKNGGKAAIKMVSGVVVAKTMTDFVKDEIQY